MMNKLWKIQEKIPDKLAENIIGFLSPPPNLPHQGGGRKTGEGNNGLLAQLLYNRGLTEKQQIDEFLEPKYEDLHSPFLFKDMQKAVERVWRAINGGEKITIYGDYDADAVTANAVLQQTFRYLGVAVESYIPDRFTEGYGVNMDALEKISAKGGSASGGKDQGSKIIITVDCGTNSTDAAEFCKNNQIDLIITDHHELVGELPAAYALMNPKNPDDNYPYQEITGVGVAFKLACGILSEAPRLASARSGQPATYVAGWEKWLLDLVAIGTVADCHSLLGENRILVKYGLKVLAKTRWTGLKALITSAALDFAQRPPDGYTLGFVIAPRLNAAGRLEHANIALELLLEQDAVKAEQQAKALEQINSRRQNLTLRVLSEAKEKVAVIQDRKILVLVGEGWPKGVVGLVAGKLAEEFYKPVIVLERTQELCTGSARSAGEFNIIEALKFSSEHLVKFGGHKQAAGLTLQASQFDFFYQKMLLFADANLDQQDQKSLELEAGLEEENLSLETLTLINQLEPFGVDNPWPKFLLANAEILSFRVVGNNGQHLQLVLKVKDRQVAAIAFNFAFIVKSLKVGNWLEAAVQLILDGWNGKRDVKLKIIDLKLQN